MPENIKSVLVVLTKELGPEEDSSAVGYSITLAQATRAHLTVQAAAQRLQLTSVWAPDFATTLTAGHNHRMGALARAAADQAEGDAAAAGVAAAVHSLQLPLPELLGSFTALSHVHDFIVIDAEPEFIHPDRDLLQALLVQSGRPLIVVPSGCDTFRARRILVAWDGSGRAARAVHDALPFLREADAVQVVEVTVEKTLPQAADGSDIVLHLTRHGVPVETESAAARDGDVAQALRDTAERHGADMIVMGGYVHSRLRELVFGGVTQSLLKSSPVPLLMSH